MKKYVFLIFVLLTCCKSVERVHSKQFLVKTIVIDSDGKDEKETLRYFYLSNSTKKDIEKLKAKIIKSNNLNSMLVHDYKGIPIFHFVISKQ